MHTGLLLVSSLPSSHSGAAVLVTVALAIGCGGGREPIIHHAGGTTGAGGAGTAGAIEAGGVDAAGSPSEIGGTDNSVANAGRANGGSSNMAGSPGLASSRCGLPAAGAPGVAKPNGTPGNLTVLNWAGFKGAVTYTFDDANSSQITNYAALQALGVHMTFYLQTGKSEAGNAIWIQALKDGHELGNHTQSHPNAATAADIDAAQTFIQNKFGVRAWTMAAPYGDSSYVALAKERFLINRGVSNALIAPNGNSDPFSLNCYIPPGAAAASAFNAQVDSALSGGGWRVVLVHGFTGGSDGAYQAVSINEFTSAVAYAKSLGSLWIDTMVNVGSYWRGQKAFPKTATTTGTEQTFAWTLPANFPPGKCLRVKVDGGTLKQGDEVLEWDDHGYYELALDAGSVTLSP